MKSLTHGEFIEKLARYKSIAAFRNNGERTWQEVASEFDLFGPMQAASAVRYYEKHALDPVCPVISTATHYTATKALRVVQFQTTEQMRTALISKFSASVGIAKPYPKDFPRHLLRILLKASGLEWFEKGYDRRMHVHWKHDKELAA